MTQRALVPTFVVGALACSLIAVAAPNEIKVFTDELANYGEHTLETHVNKASNAGPGDPNRLTPLRVMPEYSYGIWRNWEFSLQLPAAFNGNTNQLEGYRAELQYVAPHDDDEGFYWGFNFELARSKRMRETAFSNIEFTPILGYRTDRWHFVVNPGIEKAISGASHTTNFQPAAKVAYKAFGQYYIGIEGYVDAGPLRHALPANQQSRMLYFAWDGKVGKSDVNIGVGRGFTDASDRWVIKTVFEFTF